MYPLVLGVVPMWKSIHTKYCFPIGALVSNAHTPFLSYMLIIPNILFAIQLLQPLALLIQPHHCVGHLPILLVVVDAYLKEIAR
jgi:hypothetical protein